MTKEYDRFDFEQQLLDCWKITEDVKTVIKGINEDTLSTDETAETLLGLKNLYELKFNLLWDLFENPMMNIIRDYITVKQENKMLNEELAAMIRQHYQSEGTHFGKLDTQGNGVG